MRSRRPAGYGLLLIALLVGCTDPVAEQLALLKSPDLQPQLRAIKRLKPRATDDPRVLPALVGAAGSEEAEVRLAAHSAIGAAGSQAEPHLPLLVAACDDPDRSVRVAAALAVKAIDPGDERATDLLEQALLNGDGPVFLAIGKLGADGAWATPTLVRLLGSPKPRLRNVAAMTLGRIGPAAAESLDALRRLVRDPDSGVRTQAQDAIRKISNQR